MGEINDEEYWLEPDRTDEEKKKSYDEHRSICQENKKKMTPEEYKEWMDFFD